MENERKGAMVGNLFNISLKSFITIIHIMIIGIHHYFGG